MIVAYCRVSTGEQADSGLGMEAQRAAIIQAFGEPDAWHSDEGLSGSSADRPGLIAALDALKKGDILAVAKRDRLARDMFLSCWIEKEAKRRGATIQAADGNGNGDDPADVLLRRVVDAFAEYERAMIAARTKAALKAKRERGEATGGEAPYGYRKENGRLVAIPEEQGVISTARHLRQQGKSLRAIARTTGLPHPETVRRILGRTP